jgi:hypothetical protein
MTAKLDYFQFGCYPDVTLMQSGSHDNTQAMQRIRVGMTGLAAVVLLIGVGSAIYTSASNEEPVTAIGAPRPNVVADLTAAPTPSATEAAKTEEPLAELGVAPSTSNTATATPIPAVPIIE